jgi:protein dithiol oxidoreductase (disulfide-forming)
MNCETIDSILNDHVVARLTPAERQRAAEHVNGCARCSAAWAADDALRGDVIDGPAPDLFPSLLRRVAAAQVQRKAAARTRVWWLAGAAAVVAAVAIAGRFGLVEPGPIAQSTPLVATIAARLGLVEPDASAQPARYVAGRHYDVLPGATARTAAGGRIEVIEFFMFWCFHCYTFEPDLDRWEAQAPNDVSLTRVPAMFNPDAQLQARAYYTAEVLGKVDAMRDAFYDEIHVRGNALASRPALAEFFERFGVDAATFDATFDSSEVDTRLQRAAALARQYGIVSTPTLVIGGRYSTNPKFAATDSPEPRRTMLAIVDQLVAGIRACQDRCAERAQAR